MAKELIERYEFEPLRLKLLLIKEKLQLYQECIIQRKKINFTVKHFQTDLILIKKIFKKL